MSASVCVGACICNVLVCSYTCTCASVLTLRRCVCERARAYVRVCAGVRIHVCMGVYVWVCACMVACCVFDREIVDNRSSHDIYRIPDN